LLNIVSNIRESDPASVSMSSNRLADSEEIPAASSRVEVL